MPDKLGISHSDWEQYPPAKQQELIADYEQTEQRRNAIRASSGNGIISVRISEGQMLLPPYVTPASYTPVAFEINEGDCHKQIAIMPAVDGDKAGKLEVCYRDNVLYLDPSRYDPAFAEGSVQFSYMPAWKRTFIYPGISSTGLLKMKQVNISIKQIAS